jgi:hypothetical protein
MVRPGQHVNQAGHHSGDDNDHKIMSSKLPESLLPGKANFACQLLRFQYPIYEGKRPHND